MTNGKQHRGAEVAVDPDRIQDGRWVHDAMIECWQGPRIPASPAANRQ